MLITVVDLPSRKTGSTTARFPNSDGLEDRDHVLFVPLARSVSLPDVDTVLVERADAWMRTNTLTVLGVHGDLALELTDDVIDNLWARVSARALCAITPARNGELVLDVLRRDEGALPGFDRSALISALQHADMRALLFRAGAHLPPLSMLHYEGPNGHHYRAFLRPGFALHTVDDLDRVAFWLFPHVRQCTRIVVDHWSMIGLAHHVLNYSSRVDDRATKMYVESLGAYDEPVESLESRLALTLGPASQSEAAILLSINSSGSLVRDVIAPALARAGHDGTAQVALAATEDNPEFRVPALLTFDSEFGRMPAGEECTACDTNQSAVLPIQRDSYLLALPAYTSKVAITQPDAQAAKNMMSRYGESGVFFVHRDHGDRRHHAYYVDVAPMLSKSVFGASLDERLHDLSNPAYDLVIHPRQPAPARFAEMVAQRLGISDVIPCDESTLLALDGHARELVVQSRRILVVDDVVITGRRLQGYRDELIKARRASGCVPEFDMGCVVAVARTRHESALRGTRDITHHRLGDRSFVAVETLFMPSWDERECPWCHELRLLTSLDQGVQELPLLARRLELLRARDGLKNDLYFDMPRDVESEGSPGEEQWAKMFANTAYVDRYWELNKGSVFGNVQGADLALSIASSLQHMRMREVDGVRRESKLDESFRPPIAKILDPDLYLLGRFYEPALIAGILRAARPADIRAPGTDAELAECMLPHLGYLRGSSRLASEFLVQAALGKLPFVRSLAMLGKPSSGRRRVAQALNAHVASRRHHV